MTLKIVCGVLVAMGLIPFLMAVWVLLLGGEFNAGAVSAFLLAGIGFFTLSAVIYIVFEHSDAHAS